MKTGERAMTKFMGLLCLNPTPLWVPSSSLPELLSPAAAKASGEAMAPARSCEKEVAEESLAKKLETRVMGPGLTPPPPAKKASAMGRGGRVMVGRAGAAAVTASAPALVVDIFFAAVGGLVSIFGQR